MASQRLGLGTRARRATTHFVKRSEQTTSSALVRHNLTPGPPKRRGYGLFDAGAFDSDADGDSDMGEVDARPAVRFTGDDRGFDAVRKYDASSGDESAQRRTSSRKSKHTTPSRSRSARPARRQTPYSTTTGRALARARREKGNTDDEELMNRPIDHPFSDDEEPTRSKRKSKPSTPFRMSGARRGSEQIDLDEEDALADIPTPVQQTPTKNLFSTNSVTTPGSSRKSPKSAEPFETPSKTWRQWLKSIIPASAKKLVGTPSKPSSPTIFKTPEQPDEDKSLMIPGSFEKASEKFVNPNILEVANSPEHNRSPVPITNSNGLFTYNTTTSSTSPGWGGLKSFRESRTTQNTPVKAITESEHTTPQRSMAPLSGATSMRKPSNFIQRLKSAKTSHRYDPYARTSKTPKRRLESSETKGLTAEEELELLERRERDRKVQEAEDKYKRRETLKKLGREDEVTDNEGDRSMVDASVATSPVKKHGRSFGLPPMSPSDDSQSQSTTPPNTPPRESTPSRNASPEKNLFSSAPLFQPIAPPRTTSSATSPPANDFFGAGTLTPPASFNSDADDQSDKENLMSPPPPPTMSHRQLPEPTVAAAPPPMPSSLFADKPQPIGGFGLSAPAPVLPPSPAPLQRFQKHKPRVGSSLRNEAANNTENYDVPGKENAISAPSSSSSASGSGSGLKSKTFGQTSTATTTTSTRGALGEMGSNSLTQGIKIDLRAKVAALPVKDLASLISWPTISATADGVFTYDDSVKSGLMSAWTATAYEDMGSNIFAEARRELKV